MARTGWDLEFDEIWSFVGKKQGRLSPSERRLSRIGDQYCFIALERTTRLVVAWNLGKRDEPTTSDFITKVRDATSGPCRVSTDAFPAYQPAIDAGLHDRADYGRIIKVMGPGTKEPVMGNPDLSKISTCYVERTNATLRQWTKRMARGTYAFSKKWENLRAALAMHFFYYNFCRIHGSLRVTPAMESGLTSHVWGLEELAGAAA